MAHEDERRRQPRFEVSWPVKVFTDAGAAEGEARNISSEGIHICCGEVLRLGEVLSLSILVPDCEPLQMTGKVMWSDFYAIDETHRPVCLGMSLVEISDEDHRTLEDLISSHLQ